jgi:iron complex outermembrane recepter protein
MLDLRQHKTSREDDMKKFVLFATTAAVAALSVSSLACAQEGASAEDDMASNEIIVTANKREERLTDVATSISVVTGASLEQSGASQFSEYFDKVPGLSAVSFGTPGRSIVSLRGISTGASQVNATVGTYINDVPFGSAGGLAIGGTFNADPNTFDIARVEVLKGPQGTLYGASTLGGLIKTVYATPVLGSSNGRAMIDGSTVEGGSQGFMVNGMVNLSTNDRFGIRAVVSVRRDPGFIDSVSTGNVRNNFNSANAMGGRFIALFKPTESFSAELTAIYQYTDSKGANIVDLNPVTLKPTIGDLKTGETFITPKDKLEYQIYAGKLIYDLGPASVTSVTSYGLFRDDSRADVTNSFGFGPLLFIVRRKANGISTYWVSVR